MAPSVLCSAAFLALCASAVDAATKVAVLEFGSGGSVRRTTSKIQDSTVEDVASFWSALHRTGRKPQHPGMTLVPDLFNKADSSVVVGISGDGVHMDKMPHLSELLSQEEDPVVGHMRVPGQKCHDLMSKVSDVEDVDSRDLVVSAINHCGKQGIAGFKTTVDPETTSEVDNRVADLISEVESVARSSGKSIVLHLVVEEEESDSHRRLDEADEGENNGQEQNANANGNQYNGYFGYGYYNAYGEWVTPYKTMFQIQYFNVVLWTAVGLTLTLFFTIYLMMYMPLEPDTLLFGESAKVVGE